MMQQQLALRVVIAWSALSLATMGATQGTQIPGSASSWTPESVLAALGVGTDANARSLLATSALKHAASGNDDPAVMRALLDAGGDVNTRGEAGLTPLMYSAASNANPYVLRMLLDAGADLEARADDGMTALMHAAGNVNPAVLV